MTDLVLTSEEVEVILSHRRKSILKLIAKNLSAISTRVYSLEYVKLSEQRSLDLALELREHADIIIKQINIYISR